jgi:hypothetical protein
MKTLLNAVLTDLRKVLRPFGGRLFIGFFLMKIPILSSQSERQILNNLSFESIKKEKVQIVYRDTLTGKNRDSVIYRNAMLTEWRNCGFKGESPFDVHPNGLFGVNVLAYEGEHFVGMVVRDNGTWETMGQKLNTQLRGDTCYALSFYAMCSPIYQSYSRKTGEPVNFNQPVRLRVWGGSKMCQTTDLLTVTQPITHRYWSAHTIYFKPQRKTRFLRFDVFYTEGVSFYNGNILIDKFSDIKPCSCNLVK